jgi:2-oxoglutarate/2-oxoacid ferredoxin oxidoreductase subunit beta
LAGLNLAPHQVAIFGGIGCSGKAVYYLPTYGVHTLHGRVLPYATGAKLANPEPTIQGGVNPLMLALAAGYTWIGRGYAYYVRHLVDLIQRAIRHPGLAYLDVLQPCPTYNDLHTKDWFAGQDREGRGPWLYDVEQTGYDPRLPEGADEEVAIGKMTQFVAKAQEWDERIPIGVLLENLSRPTFEQRIAARIPSYRSAPPARRRIADVPGRPLTDLSSIFAELAIT